MLSSSMTQSWSSVLMNWLLIWKYALKSEDAPILLYVWLIFVICLLMLGVYILSRIVNKKLDIE